MGGFSQDLRRTSGYQVGYDSHISSYYDQLFENDGSLSVVRFSKFTCAEFSLLNVHFQNDFGFSGADVGQNVVVVGGSNWDASTSASSVNNAYFTAYGAYPHYF